MLQSLFSCQGLFLSVLKSNLHYYFQLQFNNLWNYLVSYLQYVRQASLHCNEVWFNTVIIVALRVCGGKIPATVLIFATLE